MVPVFLGVSVHVSVRITIIGKLQGLGCKDPLLPDLTGDDE